MTACTVAVLTPRRFRPPRETPCPDPATHLATIHTDAGAEQIAMCSSHGHAAAAHMRCCPRCAPWITLELEPITAAGGVS